MNEILSEYERNNLIELTKDLIKIPSSAWDDESVYSYAYEFLDKKNLNPIKGDKENFALDKNHPFFNVLSKIGNGKGPKVLINGHLDTVTAKSEWFYPKYSAKEADGKIYGLGAADMKAGCAIGVSVFEKIKNLVDDLEGELFLSLVYGEESPFSIGSDELLREYDFSDYDLIIVTEPSPVLTIDNYCFVHEKIVKNPKFPVVVSGAEGRELFELEFFGENSHASHPKRGTNAIQDASKVITELINFNKFSDIKTGRGDYVVLNMEGGDESFTVPGYCKISINRQLGIGEKPSMVEKEIRQIIKSLRLKSKVRIERRYSPDEDVEYRPYIYKNNKYITSLIEIINKDKKKNKNCQFISSSVGDFNLFGVRTKVPTLVFGPGGGNIHSANEYVNKDEVIYTAEYLVELLKEIFNI